MNFKVLLIAVSICIGCSASLRACEETVRLLTLEQAEQIAISNNKRLQQSYLAKERDYAAFWERLSFYLPQATFSKSWGHSNSRPDASFFLGRSVDFNTHRFQLDQLILSLPLYYEIKSANWVHITSIFQYMEEFVQTIANIRVAHYRLIANQQKLEVRQEILDLLKESYENEKIKLDVGETTNFAYQRDLLAYKNALAFYYRAAADLEFAKSEWVRVLGICPEEGLSYGVAENEFPLEQISFIREIEKRITHDPSQITEPLFSCEEIDSWNRIANRYRPLIKKSQAEYRGTQELVKSAAGSYAPEVSFFASQIRNSPPEYFSTKKNYSEFGMNLNWRIFDGFGREARIVRTRKESAIAKSVLDEARYFVELEVFDRREALQNSLYSMRSSREAKKHADEALLLAKELVRMGDLTAFEYRDMVQSLGLANIELVDSEFSLISNYYLLLAVMGLQNDESSAYLLNEGSVCE